MYLALLPSLGHHRRRTDLVILCRRVIPRRPSGGPLNSLAGWVPTCHFRCMEWHASRPQRWLGYIEPCIPTRAAKPPVGPQWIHEIKHDGHRLIARKRDGRVRLFTRRGLAGPSAIRASARPWRACGRHRLRSMTRRFGATARALRSSISPTGPAARCCLRRHVG
jgi:hypothetical protein